MEKVISVQPIEDYQLIVVFDDSRRVKFDMKPYLEKGLFQQLKNLELFNSVYVDYDTVCWFGNIDIAPETIYDKGIVIL